MRRSDQRRDAIFACYQRDVTGRPVAELIPADAKPFTRELAEGVEEHRDELDEAIELAKEYCGADAPGFVNGVLGAAVREREAVGQQEATEPP